MTAKSKMFSAAFFLGLAMTLAAQPNAATQLWAYAVSYPISGSPAVGPDGTVYFANAALFAVTNGGSNKWVFPLETGGGGDYNSSPAVAPDGTIYVSRGQLFAVNPDGSQKWAYPADSSTGSPAVGLDNTALIHGYHLLYLVSAGGTMIWSNRIGGSYVYGSPVIATGGAIYAPSPENGILYAVDPGGTEKWEAGVGFANANSPAIGA